jgi:hypothetical protein
MMMVEIGAQIFRKFRLCKNFVFGLPDLSLSKWDVTNKGFLNRRDSRLSLTSSPLGDSEGVIARFLLAR